MSLAGGSQLDSGTAADVLRLDAILDYCDTTHLGRHALRRTDSVKSLYVKSITKLEKIQEVFDDKLYEASVLDSIRSEKEAYEDLVDKATMLGVPEAHIPSPAVLVKPYTRPAIDSVLGTVIHEGTELDLMGSEDMPPPPVPPKSPVIMVDRPKSSKNNGLGRSSINFSSTDKVLKGIAALVPNPELTLRSQDITPNTSVSSFFSARSQASSRISKQSFNRRTTSFMQFFRRDSRRASERTSASSTPPARPQTVDGSNTDRAPATTSQPSGSESSTHVSPSSLRSSSSFGQDLENLPPAEKQRLEASMATDSFIRLQKRCRGEAERFIEFADYQRVALPLIFGRNRVYLSERKEQDLERLEHEHELATEAQEMRHLEQEIAETERLAHEKAEALTKNVTALKHVTARISRLGAEATEEHLQRLEEEKTAMERLEKRQKREMDNLLRMQKRDKLRLQREQEKDTIDHRKATEDNFEKTSKEKRLELEKNFTRLEEAIKNRRSRLSAKWYLELQIFKEEDADLNAWWEGPLPLRLLGLPLDFTLDPPRGLQEFRRSDASSFHGQ